MADWYYVAAYMILNTCALLAVVILLNRRLAALESTRSNIKTDYKDNLEGENQRLREAIAEWRAYIVAFIYASNPAEPQWKELAREIANEMAALQKTE